MSRIWPCVATILLVACDGSSPSPTAPTGPVGSTAPPSGPPLAGIVRAGGTPVSGARVTLLRSYEATGSTLTDEAGRYHFSMVVNWEFSGALVSASLHDFFTETRYVLVPNEQTLDFNLKPAEHIQVGQVVRGVIGDDRCASLGYGGSGGTPCRRFVLTPPAAGILEVSAVSATPGSSFDLSVLKPDGTIGAYGPQSTVTIQVSAGLTYQIDVVPFRTREFELTSRLSGG